MIYNTEYFLIPKINFNQLLLYLKMNKRKSIIYVLSLLFLCYLIISLLSCNKENPVIPPEPPPPQGPDTVSQYVYTTFNHLGGFLSNVYAVDTDKVFIIGNSQLLLYNGHNVEEYPLNDPNMFIPFNVSGYDKNNIFIYGEYVINWSKELPIFKKITNGVITTYNIGDTNHTIYDFIVTGPNQAWFSDCISSKIYYFNNDIISEYRLSENDSIRRGFFYLSPDKELFVFAIHDLIIQTGTFYTYKFVNENFVLLRTDCYDEFPCNTDYMYRCGKDIIMTSKYNNCRTKYFNGNEWVFHSNQDTIDNPYKLGGISKDSLIGFFGNEKLYTYGVNKKWRIENGSPLLRGAFWKSPKCNIEMKFGNIYFTYRDYDFDIYTSFIKGRPNKNFKN
jgi:hypothetical protein